MRLNSRTGGKKLCTKVLNMNILNCANLKVAIKKNKELNYDNPLLIEMKN